MAPRDGRARLEDGSSHGHSPRRSIGVERMNRSNDRLAAAWREREGGGNPGHGEHRCQERVKRVLSLLRHRLHLLAQPMAPKARKGGRMMRGVYEDIGRTVKKINRLQSKEGVYEDKGREFGRGLGLA